MRVQTNHFLAVFAMLLSGCSVQHYQASPIVPADTAKGLESRTLSDPGLHAFLEKNLGKAVSPWPPRTWDIETLSLAALYLNPSLDPARARLQEADSAIVTAGARPNPISSLRRAFPAPTS